MHRPVVVLSLYRAPAPPPPSFLSTVHPPAGVHHAGHLLQWSGLLHRSYAQLRGIELHADVELYVDEPSFVQGSK
jgi:hypothetical protein